MENREAEIKPQSSGPSKDELDYSYKTQRLQVIGNVFRYFFVTLAVLGCAVCFLFSIRSLAGHATTAVIVYKLGVLIKAPKAIAILLSWALAGGTTTWAVLERKRAERTIAKYHPERRKQQLAVDPNKRSSGITLHGKTGPKDV